MSIKRIFLIIMLVILAGVIVFAAVYTYMSINAGRQDKTVIIPTGGKFQTNLKDSRNIILLSYQVEVERDKKLIALIEERSTQIRSKVLDILRDKTVEEVEGTQGKTALEKEILQYYHSLFDNDRITNVFIDDLVVQ